MRKPRSVCAAGYPIEGHVRTSRTYFGSPYKFASRPNCWPGCGPQHDEIDDSLLREIRAQLDVRTYLVLIPLTRVLVEKPLGVWPLELTYIQRVSPSSNLSRSNPLPSAKGFLLNFNPPRLGVDLATRRSDHKWLDSIRYEQCRLGLRDTHPGSCLCKRPDVSIAFEIEFGAFLA